MSLSALLTHLYHALYAGKITKIYGRRPRKKRVKINGRQYESYFAPLPASLVRSWEEMPKELIMLETEHGDLVILNPTTAKMVTKLADTIVKSGKAKIDLKKFQRESGLWLTFRKYKGAWKSAERRTGGKGRKEKSNWVEWLAIGRE